MNSRKVFDDNLLWHQVVVELANEINDWRILSFAGGDLDRRFSTPSNYVNPKRLLARMFLIDMKLKGRSEFDYYEPFPGVFWLSRPDLHDNRFEISVGVIRLHAPVVSLPPEKFGDSALEINRKRARRIIRQLDLTGRVAAEVRLAALERAVSNDRAQDLFGIGRDESFEQFHKLKNALGITA